MNSVSGAAGGGVVGVFDAFVTAGAWSGANV